MFHMESRRPPAWLIMLSIFVYGGLFLFFLRNPANSVKTDSQGYLLLAENLRVHHVLSADKVPPYTPDVYRLPGYPLFLAATDAITPSSIRLAIALQCLMGIVLVFIVWPFFYQRGGPMGALLGTVFLCFDLMAVLHQDLVLTEALYTLLFSVALCCSILCLEQLTMPRAAAAGFFFGLAALIKPISLIPAGLLLLCTFQNWRKSLWLGVFILILPASWVVRNRVLTGYPVYTIQGNFVLLQYPAAGVLAADTGRTRRQVMEELEAKLRSEEPLGESNPVPLSRAYERAALHILEQHPVGTMRYLMVQAIRIMGGTGMEMILDQLPTPLPRTGLDGSEFNVTGGGTLALLKAYPGLIPFQLVYTLFVLASYLLFAKGILELIRKGEWRLAAFLVFSVLLTLLVSTLPGGTYRLRIALLPFLAFGIASGFPSKHAA
jgi:hypothetical protein